MGTGISISEAAAALGVSEKTIRRRIKAGLLQASRVPAAGGFEYRIDSDALARVPSVPSTVKRGHVDQGDGELVTLAAMDMMRAELAEKERQIAELQAERLRMAEQLGYAKAQIQQMQAQMRLLGETRSEPSASEVVQLRQRGVRAWLRRRFRRG